MEVGEFDSSRQLGTRINEGTAGDGNLQSHAKSQSIDFLQDSMVHVSTIQLSTQNRTHVRYSTPENIELRLEVSNHLGVFLRPSTKLTQQ